MELSALDAGIIAVYLVATMTLGIAVRKYVGRVEDFIVAGREVNLYLGIASLAATEFGIVTCMYTAQNGFEKGFAGATPGVLYAVAMVVVGLTGFCIKPLRESGVMTVPEMFEKRFGSHIRWLAGVVIVLGGLLNMGMFLRVGGEFLVHLIGLPPERIEITMTVLLIGVAVYTILGGMLSVLVTDFLQFLVMSVGMIAVTILILVRLGWTGLTAVVEAEYGAGAFNPFIHEEMGVSYVVFNALLALASILTWQTIVQRLLAARDTATGRKMYVGTSFFFVCRFLLPGIWGMAALTVVARTDVENTLHAMPMFLSGFVPAGLMGILLAAMLAADMSTNSSYMLSWGSVIYNDILAPFRRTVWSEKKGIFWNRVIIGLIGVFLLFYGLWYELRGDLWTYLGLTGTIYLSSMMTLLVACCYWKRANDWGAAGAIAMGATLPVAFLVLEKVPATQPAMDRIGPHTLGIAAYVGAALAMVAGSWLKVALTGVQPEGGE